MSETAETCKHEDVMVYTIEQVSQRYDFGADDWTGLSKNAEIFGVIEARCDDCGKDLTKAVADRLGRATYETKYSEEQGWELHKGEA